jgi:transposase
MSRVLKVSDQTTIASLAVKGWSIRRIARMLGVNRRTVRRYYGGAAGVTDSKCTTPGTEVSAGIAAPPSAKCTTLEGEVSAGPPSAKCTTCSPKVSAGSRSGCAGFTPAIEPMIEAGLSAQRIYQDLRAAHGFSGSYAAVKRFVAALKAKEPQRVWRIECQPGEEMQVDFGMGPMVPSAEGKKRRSWIFRAVLSHSRKGYSEAVFRQDTESFLRVLENAMRAFGGVPLLLNLDNLKAAVIKADWFDPQFNPKFAAFCRHYGIDAMPCRPYTPQHKGKVERGVDYVKNNGLKGHEFDCLSALNAHLRHWEQTVADHRIHGTTRQQVRALFEQVERAALQPLPPDLFPCYQEARRSVHRDGYVEVAKAYYEAPVERIGRSVWVRWDARSVQLFDDKGQLIASHVRLEPGRYSRSRGVRGLDHAGSIQATAVYWVKRAQAIGAAAGSWAQQASEQRGAEAIRSLMGLCRLLHKHRAVQIDSACAQALAAHSSGTLRLRSVTELIAAAAQAPAQQQSLLPFAEAHPIIRQLNTYSEFIAEQSGAGHSPHNPNHHDNDNTTTSNEPPCHFEDPSAQTAA